MPAKLTQEEAERKSINVGTILIGEYINAKQKAKFECPQCKKHIFKIPTDVWKGHILCWDCGIKQRSQPKLYPIGTKFNNFIVIDHERGKHHWLHILQCTCGNIRKHSLNDLIKKNIQGCNKCYIRANGNKHVKWNGYKEISGSLIGNIKSNAQSRNLEYNINKQELWNLFIQQNRCCYLSGKQLQFGNTYKQIETTASLDRIDSSQGYISNNVVWTHKQINLIKREFDLGYFLTLCLKINNHQFQKNK